MIVNELITSEILDIAKKTDLKKFFSRNYAEIESINFISSIENINGVTTYEGYDSNGLQGLIEWRRGTVFEKQIAFHLLSFYAEVIGADCPSPWRRQIIWQKLKGA